MSEISCLKCKAPVDSEEESCPECGEKITLFQRTYATKLIDGKYQIIDRLGLGGMGEIFKVRHIHLNELRVIKIMRPNIAADDQGLQRFLQEARTSTMIKHRNLAMLYDFSTLDDGSYYMVWEFIDGTNIQKWMGTNGAVPSRLAMEIAIQALDGLEHLHSMGLIHRDISPENIMLSQDNKGKLLAKVIDFGIAKQLTEGEGGQGLTQTGMFLGKLKYASPEQAGFMKEGEHLDPRSDLYSFGIVLYEMLAGRAPFQATNPHGYILKHATEKPLPISQLNPEVTVPPKLEAIVFKALEKDRDDRYPSAAAFVTALDTLRNEIAPDKKYGLGEKMITLSGAATLADMARPMATGGTMAGATGRTAAGRPPATRSGPTGTRSASAEATVLERGATGAAGVATTIERKAGGAGAEATVLERKGGSAGTAAEPTMIDQSLAGLRAGAAAPKKKSAAMLAIAAVVVLAIGAGAWFAFGPKTGTGTGTVTVTSGPGPGTVVDATANPPWLPAGKAMLFVDASPYGRIEEIINRDTKQSVLLSDEDRDTPFRLILEPGKYDVRITGPQGKSETVPVQLEAGESERVTRQLSKVDPNEIYEKMNRP